LRILNFGSLNLDLVYTVDHIAQPGETISSYGMQIYCGGKGLNQSIALARAGSAAHHAGMIGSDGDILLTALLENGVNAEHVRVVDESTGNAMIQVSKTGQNSIVLFGGANQKNETAFIDEVLSQFEPGDMLLMQNEVNLADYLIAQGAAKGMRIVLNPSPYNEIIGACDLSKISLFLINEVEGEQMTGRREPDEILSALSEQYPASEVVLTLGSQGTYYMRGEAIYRHPAYDVPVVDTTGAGDTFTGYFLTALSEAKPPHEALQLASLAAALTVSRPGAAASIPWRSEVTLANYELRSD